MRASRGCNSLEQVNDGLVPAREINPYGAEHAYVQVADDVERRIPRWRNHPEAAR